MTCEKRKLFDLFKPFQYLALILDSSVQQTLNFKMDQIYSI